MYYHYFLQMDERFTVFMFPRYMMLAENVWLTPTEVQSRDELTAWSLEREEASRLSRKRDSETDQGPATSKLIAFCQIYRWVAVLAHRMCIVHRSWDYLSSGQSFKSDNSVEYGLGSRNEHFAFANFGRQKHPEVTLQVEEKVNFSYVNANKLISRYTELLASAAETSLIHKINVDISWNCQRHSSQFDNLMLRNTCLVLLWNCLVGEVEFVKIKQNIAI